MHDHAKMEESAGQVEGGRRVEPLEILLGRLRCHDRLLEATMSKVQDTEVLLFQYELHIPGKHNHCGVKSTFRRQRLRFHFHVKRYLQSQLSPSPSV